MFAVAVVFASSVSCFPSGLFSSTTVQGRPLRWMGRSHSGLVPQLVLANSPCTSRVAFAAHSLRRCQGHLRFARVCLFWGSRVVTLRRLRVSPSSLLRIAICSSFSRPPLFSDDLGFHASNGYQEVKGVFVGSRVVIPWAQLPTKCVQHDENFVDFEREGSSLEHCRPFKWSDVCKLRDTTATGPHPRGIQMLVLLDGWSDFGIEC